MVPIRKNYKLGTSLEERDHEWAVQIFNSVRNLKDTVIGHGFKNKQWFIDFKKELEELLFENR